MNEKFRLSNLFKSNLRAADVAQDVYLQLGNIGRCEILAPIGEGGMGIVYRGRHHDLDLDVAIKFLRSHLVDEPQSSNRFLREARLAARMSHPHIVRVFDCGESGGHYYIVLELIDGQSLADQVAAQGVLPVGRALQITEAIARALDHARREVGLIHRDIKPSNILMTASGQPKLADLGLAKSIDADAMKTAHTAAGTVFGTPAYMPPEQFVDASTTDHRGDIYSLGATLYHVLAGHPPFEGRSYFEILKQVSDGDPPPLPRHVPLEVQEVILRMMAKRPGDRYQDYTELIESLQSVQRLPDDTEGPVAHGTRTASIPEARTTGRLIRPASPVENRVLIVVDIQNDFCPEGALAVPDGDKVVSVINRISRRFSHVILTQDWHREDHLSFASSHPGKKPLEEIELPYGPQILWPDHCVERTRGAEFHPDLDVEHCELIIRKGYHREIDSYSAFFENDRQTPTGLAGYLRERGLTRVFIVGLATDFCVAYSALDARRLDFEVTVIEDGCRGIDIAGSLAAAWDQMESAGVIRA
ncbi:MAG: bifunctional nicotinamidase/pyrazinamidase [Planctomycetaceae bacterium]|nr:bifunctional nicotinamidase/pyrazinamidase [Planctomycetaceae bacterium]